MTTTNPTICTEEGVPLSGGLPAPASHRLEDVAQLVILLAVGGMAGAASFTHVHDWTMHNTPEGTPGWFGWGNAVISELTPLAAGLEIRRRRRTGQPIGYPAALLAASVTLSLAAQVAEATPSPTGWLLSAVPALAFLALSKLVLSRAPATVQPTAPTLPTGDDSEPRSPKRQHAPVPTDPAPGHLAAIAPAPVDIPAPEVPAHLLPGARFAVANHEQNTGRPITADELAARMSIPAATAGQLLATLGSPTEPARVNGTAVQVGGGA